MWLYRGDHNNLTHTTNPQPLTKPANFLTLSIFIIWQPAMETSSSYSWWMCVSNDTFVGFKYHLQRPVSDVLVLFLNTQWGTDQVSQALHLHLHSQLSSENWITPCCIAGYTLWKPPMSELREKKSSENKWELKIHLIISSPHGISSFSEYRHTWY